MIDLNSKKWNELRHAYGDASDIPELLRQLEDAPYPQNYQSEPWFTLWSALCHQYSVFTASYAAVPHLIRIAQNKERRLQLRFIDLIASIHCFRTAEGQDPIPDHIQKDYEFAIEQSLNLCYELIKESLNEDDLKGLLGSIATLKNYNKLGALIYELQEETECQECGASFQTIGLDVVT